MPKVTYYLEVISSWCYWAEPAWAELKQRYGGKVEFNWKIAQMPPGAYAVSKSQCEWYYRRSGSIMHSPFMLNADWFDSDIKEYLVPNNVAEAARAMGATDDRVRLAIAHAALRDGQKIGRWEIAVGVAARAAGLDTAELLARAQSPEIAARTRATSAEFDSLQINQRPAFLIENSIGDRAVFSGIARSGPLAAALDSMLQDEAAYTSWKAHFGEPPN